MKVLVTGAEGYLGSLLAPRLMLAGHDVTGVDTGFYKDGWLFNPGLPGPKMLAKDIRHLEPEDLAGFDAVVHLAELSNDPTGELSPEITYEINHRGSVRLAELAKGAGVRRFIYMSSCSVYGIGTDEFATEESPVNPQTAYAICKTLVERDVSRLAGRDFSPVFLRNATAFGASPRQRFDLVLNNLCGLAWTTREIRMTSDGSPWRPLVHGLDICKAIQCALDAPVEAIHNEVFNIGDTQQNYRIREIAEIVGRVFVGCQITFGAKSSDNRSYRVSFEKAAKQLPGFSCEWDAEKGVRQMYTLFKRIDLTPDLFNHRGFTRLKQLQYLIRTNQIDSSFFWTAMSSLWLCLAGVFVRFFSVLLTLFLLVEASAQEDREEWKNDWLTLPGFTLQRDAEGFSFPSAIAFVPEPGDRPDDPLYFVTELRGKIKVVTVDRTVHTFADLADYSFAYRPAKELPEGSGESGMAGICLEPEKGYVFVTFAYVDAQGALRNNIMRFECEPKRFSVKPKASLAFTEVFAGEKSGVTHQIGNPVIIGDRLFVGVGDAWQPFLTQRTDNFLGKVLCLTFDGNPAPENPYFESEDPRNPANFVWATGLRNPFSLKNVKGRLFAADNGASLDRFLEVEKGANYLWNGNDLSITTNAKFVWVPALGPVQMDFHGEEDGQFPAGYRNTFFVAVSGHIYPKGGMSVPSGVYMLPYDWAKDQLAGVPQYFVRYLGEKWELVTGLAFGPDGLYFCSLRVNQTEPSPIFKVVYDPTNSAPAMARPGDAAWALMVEKGCLGCHTVDDHWGFGGTAGPHLPRGRALVDRLLQKLTAPDYTNSLARFPFGEQGPHFSYRVARQEVLAAEGVEKVRTWLKYYLQDPIFDKEQQPQMPILGIQGAEAELLTDYLLAGAVESPVAGLRALVDRVLPAQSLRRRHLALFFAGGFAVGGTVLGSGAFWLCRSRQGRTREAETFAGVKG